MGRWDCPVVGRGWGREQKERKGVGEAEKIQENQEGERAPKQSG